MALATRRGAATAFCPQRLWISGYDMTRRDGETSTHRKHLHRRVFNNMSYQNNGYSTPPTASLQRSQSLSQDATRRAESSPPGGFGYGNTAPEPRDGVWGATMKWVAIYFLVSLAATVLIGPLIPQALMMPLYFGLLAYMIFMGFRQKGISPTGAKVMGCLTVSILGVLLYPTLGYYVSSGSTDILVMSLVGAVTVFSVAGIVGYKSSKTLYHWGGMLFGLVLAFIALSMLNAFVFHQPVVSIIVSIGVLVIFTIYSYIDIQRIRDRASGGVEAAPMYALSIFLDIYNLFVSLLNILGLASRN